MWNDGFFSFLSALTEKEELIFGEKGIPMKNFSVTVDVNQETSY